MEGSLVAYKVFSNGSVLNASEINDNLMRQSVMVFSNAAARSAAITVPLEGMLTWLEDVNDYQYYNGASWIQLVPPTGLVLVKSQAIGSGVSSITVNDAFNTNYDAYKVLISGGSGSTASFFTMRLGSATTQYYQSIQAFIYSSGAANNGTTNNGTQFGGVGQFDSNFISVNMDIVNPFAVRRTQVYGSYISQGSAGTHSGTQLTDTSYTSFTLNCGAGSVTGGTIFVYGYRKS
jgi:hypothetical protein